MPLSLVLAFLGTAILVLAPLCLPCPPADRPHKRLRPSDGAPTKP